MKKSLLFSLLFTLTLFAQMPTNGLVAYYPFNGNANDESGNGNNGVVFGANLTFDRFGSNNCAYNFNGTDNQIAVLANSALSNFAQGDHSFSAWVRLSVIPSDLKCIVDIGEGTRDQEGLRVNAGGTGHFKWVTTPISPFTISGQEPMTPGLWYHIVGIVKGTTGKLYINGVRVDSLNCGNNPNPALFTTLKIGNISGGGNNSMFLNGSIDDVALYNRALSDEEVASLYGGGAYGTIVYEGKTYHTVKIGTQTWMRENLDVGTMIQGTQNASNNSIIEKYCYDNNPANCSTYGALYQWDEMMQYNTIPGVKGICPDGWHLPTESEYLDLASTVNNISNSLKFVGQGTAGGSGTNASGFSALLAGMRDGNGTYNSVTSYTIFWNSTQNSTQPAYGNYMRIYGGDNVIGWGANGKTQGYSVRCIKNPENLSTIQIISPNGGENKLVGALDTIKWTSSGVTNVKVELTTNNGTDWSTVVASTPASAGYYIWTVPNTPSTQCKVKISDVANATILDTSDTKFNVIDINQFTILFSRKVGSYYQIFMTNDGFNIFYQLTNDSLNSYGAKWSPDNNEIVYSRENETSGRYDVWLMDKFGQKLRRLTFAGANSASDPSWTTNGQRIIYQWGFSTTEQIIRIVNKDGTNDAVLFNNPDDKDLRPVMSPVDSNLVSYVYDSGNWAFNQSVRQRNLSQGTDITLVGSNGLAKQNINYSSDGQYLLVGQGGNGSGGNLLRVNVITGQVAELISPPSTQKITYVDYNAANSEIFYILNTHGTEQTPVYKCDQNGNNSILLYQANLLGDLNYKNAQQFISLISPNGGENKLVGAQDTIKWTSAGGTNVKIELTTNNGTSWTNIVASTPASTGSYVWTVTNTPSTQCKIKISDASNSAIADTSSGTFKIQTQLQYGLIAYYPFNGNANDESGNGYNGTNYGAISAPDRFDNSGKAFSFNGINQYISVPNIPFGDQNTDKSISVWFKLNSTNPNDYVTPLCQAYGAGLDRWAIDISAQEVNVGIVYDGYTNWGTGLVNSQPISIGTEGYHHLVVVGSNNFPANNKLKIYIDGIYKGSISSLNIKGFPIPVTMQQGTYYSGTAHRTGNLDEIKIFNRILSQSEIDSLYYENGYKSISYGGKTYHTVTIGAQTWLKENLDIGNMIQGSQNASNNSIIEKYCYDNNPANCDTYGGFYQWSEAMQYAAGEGSQGICPFGWHIPTQADFQVLINYVNNSSNALLLNASNTSGFSAYLAGMKISSGGFQNLNSAAHFWSSKVGEPGYAYGMYLYQDANIGSGPTIQGHGYNIRCIKNETQNISVVSPNGGENKLVGSQDTIKWTSTGVINVKIELTTNNGTNWSTIVASTSASTGSYVWTVPNTVSPNCRIKISDAANSAIYDTSDVNFKIILPGGLVAYYPFNGNANDESGNGNNGTVNGASLTADRFGNGNKSYNFTNTSDYIQVADGPSFDFTATKQLSVGVWVKLNSASNGYVIDKFGTGGSEDDDFSCNIYNGIIQFSVNGPGVFKGVESNTVLTTGKWYFVLLKWDGINAKQSIYINGIKDAEITTPVLQINNTNTALRIGKPAHPASSIIGLIDDIRIYNRAITQDEVDSLYREGGYNAPPAPPTNLTGISLDKQVRLVWNKSVDTDIRKYKIYRSLNSPATILYDSTAGPHDTTKLFSGLKNGQKYYYAVKAVDSSGQLSDYSNEVAVAPTGLIAWYPFNNNANDTTSNWTPGTINNISYTSDRFGTNGRAAYINGNENSYINIGKIELLSQFTLAGWVKLDPASGTPGSALFSNSNQSAGYEVLHTGSAGGNKWKLTTGTASNITDTAQLMPNRWYYITATYDGINTGKIYINGQLSSSSASITPVLPNSTNTLLGKSAYNSNYLLGAIDDIRIYNRLLTATEVDSLYRERGWTGNDLNLVKPNGGEVIAAGSVYNVTWTATGVTSLKIEFTSDNGSDWNTVAASVNAASGSYQWTVPDINSAQCRIRISDANNSSVSDSSSTLFTIKRIPAAISLAMPENNSINLPLNLNFSWNREAESEKYEFLLGTDSLFQSKIIIVNDTLVSDTFKVVTGVLNYNTKYYWKVRGKNIAGKGVYSPVWNFTTRLASPVLMHPADDTVNVKINPTFIWGAVTGAAAYHLQAGTDSLFITGLVIDQQSLSTNSYAYSGLANNTVYYWRVKAKNSLKESEWSGINNFRTILASPQLVAPGNNTIGHELTIVFNWQQVPGASHYRIRIASDSLFSNILYNDTSAQLSKTVGNLVPLANHYWQVAAVNQYGMSLYSQFYMFKTKGTAAPVQLVQPAANQLNVTIPVQFVWRKAGDIVIERPKRGNEGTSGKEAINKYWFELTRDTVTGYVNRDTLLTENDTVKTVDTLSYNTVYYWRVKARNEVGWGVFGYWSKFTTVEPVPVSVQLVNPGADSLNLPLSVQLVWRKSLYAFNYQLQVFAGDTVGTVLSDTTFQDTMFTASSLQYNSQYTWRVRGKNPFGNSPWSSRKFTTKLGTVLLASPANDTSFTSGNVAFRWFKLPGAVNYEVKLARDTGFTNIIPISNAADTFATISGLLDGFRYYWKVKGLAGLKQGDYSATRSFSIVFGGPVLLLPADGDTTISVNGTSLQWQAIVGADNYHLQVAKDANFNVLVFNRQNLGTVLQSAISNLAHSTRYYWRVRGSRQGVFGEFSTPRSFVTVVPKPFDLTFEDLSFRKIKLSWLMNPDSNIASYRVFRKNSQSGYVFRGSVSAPGRSFIDTALLPNINYLYKVAAVSSAGPSSALSDSGMIIISNDRPRAYIVGRDTFYTNAHFQSILSFTYSDTSKDPDGYIVSKAWYLNGNFVGDQSFINVFVKQGTNILKLVVTDNDGAKDSAFRSITVTSFRRKFSGEITAGLTQYMNRYYVFVRGGTENGAWALDKFGNLSVSNSAQVPGDVLSTTSIDKQGNIYIASMDFNIYAFNYNITMLWSPLYLGGILTATPLIDDTDVRIYIGAGNNRFKAINKLNRTEAWTLATEPSPVRASAVVTKDRSKLFFVSDTGKIYCFNNYRQIPPGTVDPVPTWTANLPEGVSSSPAIGEDDNFHVATKGGKLYRLEIVDSIKIKKTTSLNVTGTPYPIVASPVLDHFGNVYVGSTNGYFFKIPNSGDIISFQTGAPIKTTAAISLNGKIYVGNEAGEVICFNSSLQPLWYYKDSSSICNSILVDSGMVYFASRNGYVTAIFDTTEPGEDSTNRPQWGTYQSDNRRSGGDRTILGPSGNPDGIFIGKNSVEIPHEYILMQNYPNPFNPTTTIEFGLPDESYVKLKIYNVAGEVIGELVNGYKSAGYHKAAWVTQHLATGVYFYSLEATSADGSKNFKSIKKMLYLK